jgi:4-hydroxybenzoate polyprenyltransferase/phosphoserine phosphatase
MPREQESLSMRTLCVDLDGTLIHSDLLVESFLTMVKRKPRDLWRVFFWLLRGKAVLKAELAKRVTVRAETLPYDERFLAWLREQRAAGRELWLCTASNYRLAEAVAAHLGIFAGVIASTDEQNLSGSAKAKFLEQRFGNRAFDYCGNENADVPVWSSSHTAVVVNASAGIERKARGVCPAAQVFAPEHRRLSDWVRVLRPHQWAKNVLVFVPALTAQKFSFTDITAAVVAFVAFSLCASTAYVINDLLDLDSDRQHPRKRSRPFAAGRLKLTTGLVLAPLLLACAGTLAAILPTDFQLVLGGYFLLTLAYSFYLKRTVFVDVISLAGLYTSRIVAGAAAIDVPVTFWLLLFSVFIFLSLALVKRFTELDSLRRAEKLRMAGRGYHVEDLPILHSLGTAAGYLSVLVLALYINSPATAALYRHPERIWLLCILLLYWISRVWIRAHRGQMHEDPVVFALKDPISLAVGVIGALSALLAI